MQKKDYGLSDGLLILSINRTEYCREWARAHKKPYADHPAGRIIWSNGEVYCQRCGETRMDKSCRKSIQGKLLCPKCGYAVRTRPRDKSRGRRQALSIG